MKKLASFSQQRTGARAQLMELCDPLCRTLAMNSTVGCERREMQGLKSNLETFQSLDL